MMEFVLFEIKDEVGVITINRPEKLNALNQATLKELSWQISECNQNAQVRGVIITGAGSKAFVAGADISELRGLNSLDAENLARTNQELVFNKISKSEKPYIACLNGYALGGGLELAMACHIRYASENAVLGLPELTLGLIPGYGGSQRLVEIVGKSKALEMMLGSENITAEKAFEFGLVSAVTKVDELVAFALDKLKNIQNKAPLAISACLRAVFAQGNKLANGYETEILEFGKLFDTDDFKEGSLAFLEKRRPVFKGR